MKAHTSRISIPFEWHKVFAEEARKAGHGLPTFLFILIKLGWEVWKDQELEG